MDRGGLAHRIGDGVAADVLGNVAVRALSVVASVVVARTLSIADYGAATFALTIFGISEVLTDLSLSNALVRERELRSEAVDVAWTIGVLRSSVLAAILFFGAGPLSRWLGRVEVEPFIRILSLGSLSTSIGNLHVIQYQRQLRFARTLLVQNSRAIFGSSISIALLLTTRDAVSLVLGPVIGNGLTSVLTWVFVRPVPRFRLVRSIAHELSKFGRWQFGSNAFVYLFWTADHFYIGRFLGLGVLGGYAFAWRIVNTVVPLLTRSLARILLSVYATLQDDHSRLVIVARQALMLAAGVGTLLAGAVMIGAEDLFFLIGGGPEWNAAIPVARILALSALWGVLHNALSPLFESIGEPRVVMVTAGLQLALLVPALVIGSHFGGVIGVALAVASAALFRTVVTAIWVARRFGLSLLDQLRALLPGAALAAAASAIGFVVMSPFQLPLLRLLVLGVALVSVFLGLWEGCRHFIGRGAWPPLAAPAAQMVLRFRRKLLGR